METVVIAEISIPAYNCDHSYKYSDVVTEILISRYVEKIKEFTYEKAPDCSHDGSWQLTDIVAIMRDISVPDDVFDSEQEFTIKHKFLFDHIDRINNGLEKYHIRLQSVGNAFRHPILIKTDDFNTLFDDLLIYYAQCMKNYVTSLLLYPNTNIIITLKQQSSYFLSCLCMILEKTGVTLQRINYTTFKVKFIK